jgi:hypothetical protein
LAKAKDALKKYEKCGIEWLLLWKRRQAKKVNCLTVTEKRR